MRRDKYRPCGYSQALEILRNDQIDLLLLDMNMPGLSGMGVIRELKKPTYLIILTAYSFFDYAREALRYGVKDYILKLPIRSELYAAIDRFLQERKEQPGDNGLRQNTGGDRTPPSTSCRLLPLSDCIAHKFVPVSVKINSPFQ